MTYRSEDCITQKIVLFLSISVSPYVFFFWLCDTGKVKPSADGLSESRTVGGESDLHIFVTFQATYLREIGRDGVLVGIVLLSHSFLAFYQLFIKRMNNGVKLGTYFYVFLNQRGKLRT